MKTALSPITSRTFLTRQGDNAENELREQSGTIFLEFAAVVPLLFTLIVGVIEVSNAVNQYFVLSRITYEGTRFASNIAGLEVGSYVASAQSIPEIQARVQSRILTLLSEAGFPADSIVETCRCDGEVAATCFNDARSCTTNEVNVRIQSRATPVIFTSIGSFPFRFDAKGPYLYPVEGT